MQLELITAEGCATVRENVGEGLLSAAYYVEWWSRRIAEHTTEQQHAALTCHAQRPMWSSGWEVSVGVWLIH